MRKVVAGLLISLDGVVEAPQEWRRPAPPGAHPPHLLPQDPTPRVVRRRAVR